MKFIAGCIAYNESDFIEAAVRSVEPFMDKIIIIEGCHRDYAAVSGALRSIDGTCEICKRLAGEFPDKIIYIEHNGANQQDQRNKYLEHVEPGDVVLTLDGDEAYTHRSMSRVIELYRADDGLDFVAIQLLSVLPDGISQYVHGGNIEQRYRWSVFRWRDGWKYNVGGALGNQMRLYPWANDGAGPDVFSVPGTRRHSITPDEAYTAHYRFCKTPALLAGKDACYSLVRKIAYWAEAAVGMSKEETIEILNAKYLRDWWDGDPLTRPLGQIHPRAVAEYANVRFKNETELFEK